MAQLVSWNEKMTVSVKEIDDQHKELIRLINELHTAMKERRVKTVLSSILDGLVDYTRKHFALEERYFSMFNYPQTATHCKEHRAFVEKVAEFQQDFADERVLISIDIMNFLRQWLVGHIMKDDQAYVPCFKDNGLSQ